MFAYSLSGLKIDGAATGVTEVEENEITARSAVYQVLGQLLGAPSAEHYEKARDGRWVKELTEAATLLAFPWEIDAPTVADDVDEATYVAELQRVFTAEGAAGQRLWGGTYGDDRAQVLTELARSYEYYGLGTRGDEVPLDHLTAELDFMQFLTFKEAAAPSARLGRSFRRAQQDFLDRQLGNWVPALAASVRADDPLPFAGWVVDRLDAFVVADREWAAAN